MKMRLILLGSILVLACIAGIVLWTHTGSGIALADVLAEVQQTTAYRFQAGVTVSGKTPTGIDVNWNTTSTILIGQAGVKMTTERAGPNDGQADRTEVYLLPQEKAMIILRPDAKQYARKDLDATLVEATRREHYDPRMMLKRILDCKYVSLGRSKIDGLEVEGFHTTDPHYMGETSGRVDVKIWIDVKTQLPLRSETDIQVGDMHVHGAAYDFQWGYPVDANTFKPVIPPDYTNVGSAAQPPAVGEEDAISSSKLLPSNEEGAIAGLKLCADLTGQYPAKLDLRGLFSLGGTEIRKRSEPAIKQILKEYEGRYEGLSPEETDRTIQEEIKKIYEQYYKAIVEQPDETTDKLMSAHGVVMFYDELVDEGKDPAYYGKVVTPNDADKVLLRWKVADDQYRVIFGSLNAQTVDAATLAELEKDLPK